MILHSSISLSHLVRSFSFYVDGQSSGERTALYTFSVTVMENEDCYKYQPEFYGAVPRDCYLIPMHHDEGSSSLSRASHRLPLNDNLSLARSLYSPALSRPARAAPPAQHTMYHIESTERETNPHLVTYLLTYWKRERGGDSLDDG